MSSQKKIFTCVNALFLVLLAAAATLYIIYGYLALKAVASALFLLCGAFNLLYSVKLKKGGYPAVKWLILAGQLLCFVGDIVLNIVFVAGMAFFAAGHILFIAAFFCINSIGWRDVLPAALLIALSMCMLLLFPDYDFEGYLPFVLIYAVIICVMLAKAIGVGLDNTVNARVRVLTVCGALTFVISDLFLTLDDFAFGYKVYTVLCLVFYYLSLWLFCLVISAAASGEQKLKPQMNVFKRLFCRAFQFVFKIIIPLLPYRQPKPLASCKEAAELLVNKGKKRALIVTDKGIVGCGLCKKVEDALNAEGVEYAVYSDTVVNPTTQNAEEAAALYNKSGCDCLIAIGGGSAMDCAKVAGARIIKPKKPFAKMRGVLKVFGKLPLFIAVPTTAGTGSETTIAAVITNGETRDKFTIISFCLAPRYALLDPEMTVGLPKNMTSTTGMDALTHAVEAYIGGSTTRKTRKFAVQAVSIIRHQLPRAYEDGTNREARRRMQYAAYLAGYAFTVSYVGYVHAVAHSLGGKYNTPHGLANAVILPYALKRYGVFAQKRLAKLAILSGVAETSDTKAQAAQKFIAFVEDMNAKMNIPAKLKVEEGDIEELAKHADKEANPLYPVPVLINKKGLKQFYYDIME